MGVTPEEVNLRGVSSSHICSAVGSAASNLFTIDEDDLDDDTEHWNLGGGVILTTTEGGKKFDFAITPNAAIFDVVVKAEDKRKWNHFDYADSEVGLALADTDLHAPARNNGKLYDIGRVWFCWGDPTADLAVTKTIDDDTPNEGQAVEYTLTATNNGPVDATGVEVSDSMLGTWVVGDLEAGESMSMTYPVAAGEAGTTVDNTATIEGNEPDSNTDNNTATATYTVNSVDLSISKVPRNSTPEPGSQVIFDIVVTNSSGSNALATGVDVTDTLPAGMSFVAASSGGSHSNGVVTWTGLEIGIGESVSLTLTVQIAGNAGGQTLTNTVVVAGDETDPNGGPDNETTADSDPPLTVTASVSGLKFHDRDTDGERDTSNEEGLAGWTITAFPVEGDAASATTANDGTYTISGLLPGDYTICEQTNTNGLPDDGPGFTWAWSQSDVGFDAQACSSFTGYEPGGYVITVDEDKENLDFGNHTEITVVCNAQSNVVVTLGGTGDLDNPLATVTFPAGCSSTAFTSSFDVGRSNDADLWTQFVVFGGDPQSPTVIDQQIVWDVEDAQYDGNGSLVVPTTQVQLIPGGALAPVVFCNGSPPDSNTPQCLASRVINQPSQSQIQLTENYKFLGDPSNFR